MNIVLYFHSTIDKEEFFSTNNYIVVQNVLVMISNRTRELDIIAFDLTSDSFIERLIISCSDNSKYTSRFIDAEKAIISRLHEVTQLKKLCSFTKGYLFVRVATEEQR